ncbi:MAG: amidohydrolase family protein [Phycisphaerae bacterium]
MIVRARFIVSGAGDVIDNGFIRMTNGLIHEIGHNRPHRADVDYGDAVLIPGFVNAHTHLELSGLCGEIIPRAGFVDWLEQLVAVIRANKSWPDEIPTVIARGIRESIAAGVTTLGDITREPDRTRPLLAASPIRTVSFGEVITIGIQRDALEERIGCAIDRKSATDRCIIGISPHAPYTVEPDAMRACAAQAAVADIPLAVHLAETPEEECFTQDRSGPFVAYLKGLGVWDDAIPVAGMTPIELAAATGLLTPRTVVAHANYVSDNDIAALAQSGAAIAYCPRTHAAFQHAPHRFLDMQSAGINVCIATDSLASNPSLSVLDELRFLHDQHPHLPASALLAMGTLNGARALGLERVIGTLVPAKAADCAVIALPAGGSPKTWEAIFETPARPAAVYLAGELQPCDDSPDG